MKIRLLTIFLLIVSVFHLLAAGSPGQTLERHVDEFMKTYVSDNRVAYSKLADSPGPLNELVSMFESYDVDLLPAGNAQKAFWINAYNVLVIKGIVDAYPVSSPLKIDGFFKTTKRTVAKQSLTLDQIEHERIRPIYNDARIHFAIVCAAVSCPPIINEAYLAEKLDQQLEARTRAVLNDPSFIRTDLAASKVEISQIFEWFEQDFVDNEGSILNYLNRYRQKPLPDDINIAYYQYDWSLNGN